MLPIKKFSRGGSDEELLSKNQSVSFSFHDLIQRAWVKWEAERLTWHPLVFGPEFAYRRLIQTHQLAAFRMSAFHIPPRLPRLFREAEGEGDGDGD